MGDAVPRSRGLGRGRGDSGVLLPVFDSQLQHLSDVVSWASNLCLAFLLCKNGIVK